MKKIDLTNKKINNLTVIKKYGTNKRNEVIWECKCDCGNTTYVITSKLNNGHTKSCGCHRINETIKRNYKHGLSHSRLYQTWYNMNGRCYKKFFGSYQDYGGRGITVCDEWKNDFLKFYEWAMKNGYNDNLTIDRIDVNGNYEPSNCRWVTQSVNNFNKTNNNYIEVNGLNYAITQWTKILNVRYKDIYYRKRTKKEMQEYIKRQLKKLKNKKEGEE